jgi:hypothetical protein
VLKVSQPETLVISFLLVVTSCSMSALLLDVLDFPYVADQNLKNYNNNVKKKTFSRVSKVKEGPCYWKFNLSRIFEQSLSLFASYLREKRNIYFREKC